MLYKLDLVRIFFFISAIISISSAYAIESIEFKDAAGERYSTASFAEVWNKKLNIRSGKYFFVVVDTMSGKNKKYIRQNRILNNLIEAFENNQIVWINGCSKSCPSISGYQMIKTMPVATDYFKVSIKDSEGVDLINSDTPLSKNQILAMVKKAKGEKVAE